MKYFVISPLANLELMDQSTGGYFALAHLYVQNEHYRDFLKKKKAEGHFILLDNGCAENSTVTEDILIECVKDLMPNEVIAPDVLFDKDATIRNCELFIERMTSEGLIDKVNIFFAPQGETLADWVDAYIYGINNDFISTIGLSKIAVPYAFLGAKGDILIKEARQMAFDFLRSNQLIRKPIHCLGAGEPFEFAYYKDEPLMRSTDSCFTCLAALHNIDWHTGNFTRIKTPHDYFERTLSPAQIPLAEKNILFLKENCV